MMTPDQVRIVAQVYRRFAESEDRPWDSLDDNLWPLEWLDNDQLHRECDVLLEKHRQGKPRCDVEHKKENECFVPTIIDAVVAILDLYKKTGYMHKNNRYILEYYLALTQIGMIISD